MPNKLHIAELDDHAAPARRHFALIVDDLDDAVARLESAGVEVRRGSHIPGAGQQAAIRDAADNLIELNQPD